MSQPLTGLTGLAGYQVLTDSDPEATPEERMGGVADPRHSQFLADDYIRRGMEIGAPRGPYGPENQLLSDEQWFFEPAGNEYQDPQFDHTPSRRAGPFPKGILSGPIAGTDPDSIAVQLQESAAIHAIDTNADARSTHGMDALNDNWTTIEQLNPGNDELAELPKQSQSSGFMWGTRDRRQSMARQNEFGFDSSHQHRRWADSGIPGNNMWMVPGGRPLVKSLPGPARPAIGPDSPFAGQDLGQSFGIDGAVLQNVPTEYVAPPQPNLAAPVQYPGGSDATVEWY